MSLQTRVKYINRYRECDAVFKSGLGFIIEEIGLDRVLSLPKRILLRQQNDEYLEKRMPREYDFYRRNGHDFY